MSLTSTWIIEVALLPLGKATIKQRCLSAGRGVEGRHVPKMFETARKLVKKSATLQESKPQYFRDLFFSVKVVG